MARSGRKEVLRDVIGNFRVASAAARLIRTEPIPSWWVYGDDEWWEPQKRHAAEWQAKADAVGRKIVFLTKMSPQQFEVFTELVLDDDSLDPNQAWKLAKRLA